MNLLGSLSTHVQVALAVTLGLASIPGRVPHEGTAHLILRRCAKQSSELRLDNASQCRIFNAEPTLYALKMEE